MLSSSSLLSYSTMSTPSVVIVGGSVGGHAIAHNLVSLLLQDARRQKLPDFPFPRITVVEPRRGLINPIAIPRTLVDQAFAPQTFAPPSSFSPQVLDHVDFVRGRASYMSRARVDVRLTDDCTTSLPFDFAAIAVGRHRPAFVMPPHLTKHEYLAFADSYALNFRAAHSIVVVGGGAVGIEIAGELKYAYPTKSVTLLHSRDRLPPEPSLDPEFSERVLDALRALGVDVQLNTRAATAADKKPSEIEVGRRIIKTTDGREFEADCTVWCTYRGTVASEFLDSSVFLPQTSIDAANNAIKVNDDMTVCGGFDNVYAVGDANDYPVIKTAGGAIFQGSIIAQNIARQINIAQGVYAPLDEVEKEQGVEVPEVVLCENWGKAHMAVIIGQEMAVGETRANGVSRDYKATAELFEGDMSTKRIFEAIGVSAVSAESAESAVSSSNGH
ncbi:hypothetical protein BZA70DRAFT_282706 [Myxozyma melibiosi]|uniref:FAD/NAD(P)-binding domain-containing protein n=1 Tax=Myxozyma melibiosi TaxID=54550 RepID=A0ABR1F120_9ASCO